MPRLYDLMLLIDPNAPDGRQDQVLSEVQGMIESGGTLVGSHDWGDRRMAYEMDHRPEAHYHLFQFEGENDLLDKLNHQLKIMDGVLRFRIIRLKPGAPTPPPPRDGMPRERREEREPEGRVAARAAADAPSDDTAPVEDAVQADDVAAVEEAVAVEEPVAVEDAPGPAEAGESPEAPAAAEPEQ